MDDRVRDAALRCIARTGVRKTTLDDVAGEAGCSRATIYRAFPGGKDVLFASMTEREAERVLRDLAADLADAVDLEETLVTAITGATRAMLGHEALQYLMVHEPEVVLPHLSFDGLDPVLAEAVEFLAPFLRPFLPDDTASAVAEWAARVVCLYADPEAPFDLTQRADARRLIDTYLIPGLQPDVQNEQELKS
jgi:AcrR family transcriptional regulator